MTADRYRRADAASAARAAARPEASDDPLVELARLIGQPEQSSQAPPRPTVARQTSAAPPRAPEPRAPEPRAPAAAPSHATLPPLRIPGAAARAAESRLPPEPPRPEPRYDGYTSPPVRSAQPTAAPQPAPRVAAPRSTSPQPPAPPAPSPRQPAPPAAQRVASEQTGWPNAPRSLAEPFAQTTPGWRPPRPRSEAPDPALDDVHPGDFRPVESAPRMRPPPPAPSLAPAPAPEPVYADDPRYAPAADGAYETGEYVDDQFRYEDEDSYPEADRYEEHKPPRRRTMVIAAALLGFAVLGTAGAYGYRMAKSGAGEASAPIIRADGAPKKVAAAAPGPNDKQIFDRLGDRGQNERVVPREEKPIPLRDPSGRTGVPDTTSNLPPVVAPPATMPATVPSVAAPAAPGEPKRIRTVTIRPDGENPAPAAPAAATPGAPTPAPRAVKPATPAGGQPMQIAPQAAPAAPAPAPARTALAPANAPVETPVAAGSYVVQLSAQKSAEEARASFRAMQEKYRSVLGNQQVLVRKKDVAGKGTFYGSQVGPFATREAAVQLCESLRSAGGNCIVQRN